MSRTMPTETDLTKNQSLVMSTLSQAGGPLSAYSILDLLRDQGFRAPLQVYRALDKLVEYGLVHRLESLNAFVACRHDKCGSHGEAAFMICEQCGSVAEITNSEISKRLQKLATKARFALSRTTIELRGICGDCRSA